MDENEHIYTTLRMPVDPEREKHKVYTEAYSPQIDKSDWKRVNYQVDWFKKGILFWYMQKFKHKLFKNALCPREMTIWVDICIKDNIDEVKRLLNMLGTSIIPTTSECIRGFNNGNKNR